MASLIIRDTQEGREDRLGSSEGLKWVKHRELWGPRPGLGRSQLARLGLGRSQLRRLNLSRSQLRLAALRSGLEPAVKLGKLRLLLLQLWGNSQLRSLLRPGTGSSAREGCEGSWPLASRLGHWLESELELRRSLGPCWSCLGSSWDCLRSGLDWLRSRLDSLGSSLDWLRSWLDSLGSGLDRLERLRSLLDLLRLGRDDPLRDLARLSLDWGGDSLGRRNSAASGWLDGEGVVVDWSLYWLGEGPGALLAEWLEHKESVGRRTSGWSGGSRGWCGSCSHWSWGSSWSWSWSSSRSWSWSGSRSRSW